MDTIIKNGTVVTATDTFKADVGISNGKIVQIGENLSALGPRYLMPPTTT